MKSLLRVLGAFLPALAAGPARAEPPPGLMLGSSWYPEQWPEERWDADLSRMQAAGLKLARIGEFAWSSIEPAEGRYTLDWMERAIAAARAHGIAVVIGTPTDAPPAWLTRSHPDTLRIDADGQRMEHGMRRQFSYSSATYRALCRDVVGQLARRFGHNPGVIAWQIDNEYTEDSFDPESRAQFHEWLRARYGSLGELNRRWGTAYWSEAYDAWDEIPMGTGRGNPGLMLDYKRFVTDTWRGFQKNQADVIRRYADPRQKITTNLGGLGWADRFNRRDVAADLDFISWDDYIGQGHLDPVRNGATDDLVRGWRRENFWVMELQPAFVDWAPISNALDPGETREVVWEDIGHGADAVAFWQWRSDLNGQEQYHGTLVGPDGEPVPLYAEAARTAAEMARAAAALAGSSPRSEVAILHDYDSRWAIDFHPQSTRYDQVGVLLDYYRGLRAAAQSVDIVDPRVRLEDYRLVAAPSLNVISKDVAARLEAYVRAGGHLVLGPRSGMKDAFNALNPERQPGPLAADLGGRVEQFYALLDDVPVSGEWGSGSATIWAEELSARAPDARVVLRYGAGNGWLDGRPAAVTRPLGRGTITYLGAVLDAPLMGSACAAWVRDAGAGGNTLAVPAGVEVCRRVGPAGEVFILLNHGSAPAHVGLREPLEDLLGGGAVREVGLPRHGVAVLLRRSAGAAPP
ncbi:MAG: beta-galactosidase [Opitutaceae bacterium]|jgi:beta-galactosidase